MQYYEIHLKDRFPFLGENGRDPVLQVYVQDALHKEMTDMGHRYGARPSVLVCPGGGYHRVSLREAEPIAVHFLPEGFNTFILTYSTGEEDQETFEFMVSNGVKMNFRYFVDAYWNKK